MKDKISKITRSCLIAFFIFLLSACYGSWNFLYEGNNVDERTKNLKYRAYTQAQWDELKK